MRVPDKGSEIKFSSGVRGKYAGKLPLVADVSISITCPSCGMTSYNPNDVSQRYCGNCHAFHDDMKERLARGPRS
jgi:protein-arginine kinase activator protein McsA